jgi:hypothetical protein
MKRCVQVLNEALHELFAERDDVVLLGEDVLDPYGGAFKVTQGLSDAYPERVLTTPISEASLFGVAAGMALRGRRPILEIMFGDFIALGSDHTVTGIAKCRDRYADQVTVPLVVRTPMGGRRGYGPTPSHSLEKFLLGVPNVVVVAASECHDLRGLLVNAVDDDRPVFLIENKLMYGRPNRRPEHGHVGELAVRGHVRLNEERRPGGVDAASKQARGHLDGVAPKRLRLPRKAERVEVDYAVEGVVTVLVYGRIAFGRCLQAIDDLARHVLWQCVTIALEAVDDHVADP